MLSQIRIRTASILDVSSRDDRISRYFDLFIIGLILINLIAVVLESVDEIQVIWSDYFIIFERISLVIFSLEYILRVWSIVDNPFRKEYHHPVKGRLRYMCSPMAIIDLIATAPFWLSFFIPMDLRFLRVIRLLRVLKLTRYSAAMTLLFDVIREEARVLGAAMFTVFLMLTVTASATYLVENAAQPEVFSNIPQAMWWSIVTVTTVGYGDMVPITALGKIFGSLLGFIGVGMVALPAGIMASGFSNALQRRRNELRREVGIAMEDGVIDSKEHADLKTHAESLSLPETEISDILLENTVHKGSVLQCPQCGYALLKSKE